ncbi:hypothetical protein [Acinetobacter colistiniresistens]|uniref:hypothetical protein n=1 Tax=Acinetobacter colistiniresistens TaxID=280145 RepID=UPI00124F98DB|nr:hypothetical protein [Acinetobacter colistiniresistens]
MSKGNRYSDAVWMCLRDLYEASPKESIKAIRTALAEMLGVDVPSESAITRRIKNDGWEKLAKKQCNFSSKTLRKKMQKKYSENNTEVAITTAVEVSLKPSKNRQVSAPLAGIERVYQEKAFLSRKTADVILSLRKDSYVLGQYQRKLLGDLIEIEYRIDNFMEYYNTFPAEFDGLSPPDARNLLHFNRNRIVSSLGLIESLSTSLEKRARIDFVLYGINPDDTRESDSDNRITDLDEDKEYYEEQERLSLEKQKEIAERMLKLQSGVFEETVRLEALQKAAKHELPEEIEEGEFDEISD